MERKIGLVIVVLGLAAFSPAPINKAHGPRTFVPEMSQEQIAKQQAFNGTTPVVGRVPQKLNEAGWEVPPTGSLESETQDQKPAPIDSSSTDKMASSIIEAGNPDEAVQRTSGKNWILGLIVACLGFIGWKGFQYKIEKSTPVPEFSKRVLQEFNDGKY